MKIENGVMKKYDSYKDSGIEWIGEIPSHWEVRRFKYLFNEHSGNGFPHNLQGKNKGEFPFFKVSDLNKEGITVGTSNNYVSCFDVKANRWNIVPEKTILTAKIGEALKKNHRKISTVRSVIDNNCLGIEPIDINVQFAFYLLMVVNFEWFINPGAVPSISMDKLRNHFFPLSSDIGEQTAIASYLDRKTSEIDELIAGKERLLELYEDEKTAIINQAVTGKLKIGDGEWEMKDSGIEWLGEIPEHWEVKRFKYYFDLITEKVEEDLPKIGLENIESGSGKFVVTNSEFAGQGIRFMPNDILFGKLRPYLAKVWLAEFNGQAVGDFYVFRSRNDVISEFVKFRILDTSFIEVTNSSTYGSKMPRVSWEFIADLALALPPLHEQQAIVDHIEAESSRIDRKIERTQKLIVLLKEYRETLISEVVTGKVKVIGN